MDEYIKREDALDAVLFALVGTGHQSRAILAIRDIPSANVVEVVRCKDCEHRHTFGCPMYHEEYIDWDDDGYWETDLIIHDATNDNDFCNYGERKE